MDIVLDRIISNPAFLIAVSPDCTKIAISGERTITVFSFPDFGRIGKMKLAHVCSMVFLSDNSSLMILNTAGRAFIWDGIALESIGKWPVPRWQEKPLFYCGDDRVLWAGYGGIWLYNVRERTIKKIFASSKDVWICACEGGLIKCIAMNYGETESEVDLLTISLDGSIQQKAQSDIQIKNDFIKNPAWSKDNLIAISTAIASKFPLNLVYLLDSTGQVVEQVWIPAAEDNGRFVYCNNLFIKVSVVGAYNINFYDAHTLKLILKLDGHKLASYGMDSPPTFAWVAPNNQILIGSWDKLFVFNIAQN